MHSGAKVSPSGIFKIPQLIAQVPRPNPQTHGFGLEEAEKKNPHIILSYTKGIKN